MIIEDNETVRRSAKLQAVFSEKFGIKASCLDKLCKEWYIRIAFREKENQDEGPYIWSAAANRT